VHISQKLWRECNARTRTYDRIYATPRAESCRANIIYLINPIFNLGWWKSLTAIEAAAQLATKNLGTVAARTPMR
jgi:hypothetical protein